MTLTLNFQGQIWNKLYLSQKWSNCHETKSKHMDWSLGLKCDHQVWPWPWPSIFQVKYGICYISAKNGAIATKHKANITIDLKASNVTFGFDLGPEFLRSKVKYGIGYISAKMVQLPQNEKQTHGLNSRPQMWPSDLIFKYLSNMKYAISQPKMVWLPRNKKQKYQLNSSPQICPMALNLTMTLLFEFSRSYVILTIWWPRSRVLIYQIVTGWLQLSACRRLI